MSDFDRRWRRLARAASRAATPPLPPPPDGGLLLRRATVASPAAPQWPRALATAAAVGLLWAVALPAAVPAWRASHALFVRLGASAPVPPVLGAPALAAPAVPRLLPSAALSTPGLPPLPDPVRQVVPPVTEAPSAKETP
jgi:hypothetical protein